MRYALVSSNEEVVVAARDFENFKQHMKAVGIEVTEVAQYRVTFVFADGRVFEIEAQCDRFGDETALEFDLIA